MGTVPVYLPWPSLASLTVSVLVPPESQVRADVVKEAGQHPSSVIVSRVQLDLLLPSTPPLLNANVLLGLTDTVTLPSRHPAVKRAG
jgi:hypothetical protein